MSRRKFEVVFSAAIFAMALYWVWEARNLPPRVQLVPWTIGLPVLALAALQLVVSIRALRAPGPAEPAPEAPPAALGLDLTSAEAVAATATAELAETAPEVDPETAHRRGLQMVAWILAFFASLMLLGFRVAPPLMTFLFLRFASRERMGLSLAFAAGTYLVLLAADLTHTVTLSSGMLAQALGMESFDAYLVNPIIRLIRGE